jgi:hypothetical protein
MNELATIDNTQGTALAAYNDLLDGFQEHADMSGSHIVGTLLKFSKGDYLVGQNGDLMQEGTELAANLLGMKTGWIKWHEKKPVEQIMGLFIHTFGKEPKFKMPTRKELGDLDEALWETDKDGKPQDPWQETTYLVLKVPGVEGVEGLFTMPISSKSGKNAIDALCGSFAKLARMRAPGEQPIIKLGVDRYQHKEYGWQKVPVFTITGWVPAGEFDNAIAEDAAQKEADAAARKAADEDIPF